MVARVLLLWVGWRLLRILVGLAVIAAAITWIASELHSPSALHHQANGIVHHVEHELAPLIGATQRAINQTLGPAGP
jgi:hypothetical protein